jgi:hypothetical protein
MRNILAFGLASMVAADDVLSVEVTVDNAEVHRGEAVTFTCGWKLDNAYGETITDYEVDDFQLMWKLKDRDDHVSQSLARWEAGPEDNEITYYQNTRGTGRINVTANFDEQQALLQFNDMNLADDDMEIICEVHWAARFDEDSQSMNVYVDASEVSVEALNTQLEGRAQDNNGTIIEVEDIAVASCNVVGVYPEPTSMTFTVDGENVDVAEIEVVASDEGLFDMSANLIITPGGDYDGAVISCSSQAAASAEIVEPFMDANSTDITLDVTYYTDNVDLSVSGANGDDDVYTIKEGDQYVVSCSANGNPLPTITITDASGAIIESGTGIVAHRSDDNSVQYISCSASNEDDVFDLGDDVTDAASLDVHYLEEPVTDVQDVYTYGNSATLVCAATGHPEPKISWQKNGEAISNVNFEAISYDDAGAYTCTASNAANTLSVSADVKVDGPCEVSIERKEASSSKDVPGAAALELSCLVKGPECAVTWSSDAEGNFEGHSDTSDATSGLATTSTYILAAVDKQAKAVSFTCSGTNSHGTEADTVEVGENHQPFCCEPAQGGLGTGAIVGIVIAIPAILIIVGAVVFFCRKSGASDGEKIDGGSDEEAAEPEEKAPLTEGDSGEPGASGSDKV